MRSAGRAEVRGLTVNVLLVLKLKLLVSHVALSLDRFKFSLERLGDGDFINDVEGAATRSEQVGASDVEATVLFNLLQIERVVDQGNHIFALYFVKALGNLFAESESFLLLAHFLVDEGHVIVCSLLLRLFGHAEHFAKAFPDMFDEAGPITDERALNSVDERAGLFVEAIASARL